MNTLRILAASALVCLLAYGCGYQRGAKAKGQVAVQAAEHFKQEAIAHVETAKQAEQKAVVHAKHSADAHIKTEHAKKALQTAPPEKQAIPDPGKALIEAQDQEIQALRLELASTLQAKEAYKLAFEQERLRANCLEIAMEARLAAEKAARWKWGCVGFAAGIGTGYISGRIK